MGNVANGVTTPQSIKSKSKTMQNIVDEAAKSAAQPYNRRKLGVRSELDEFFRITKILPAKKNSEYVVLYLKEGSKARSLNGFEATLPVKQADLPHSYVGGTYLSKGMTIDDVDEDSYVTLESLQDQIGKDSLDGDFFVYGYQIETYTTKEKPAEKWTLRNIVDDNDKIVEEAVYVKKRLVRADGSIVE